MKIGTYNADCKSGHTHIVSQYKPFVNTTEHCVPQLCSEILPFNPIVTFLGLYLRKQRVTSTKTNGRGGPLPYNLQ